MEFGYRVEAKMGFDVPSSRSCSRDWRIKRKSESLLGGGVVGENRVVIVRAVKAEQGVEISGRSETHGMGRECEEWGGGSQRE